MLPVIILTGQFSGLSFCQIMIKTWCQNKLLSLTQLAKSLRSMFPKLSKVSVSPLSAWVFRIRRDKKKNCSVCEALDDVTIWYQRRALPLNSYRGFTSDQNCQLLTNFLQIYYRSRNKLLLITYGWNRRLWLKIAALSPFSAFLDETLWHNKTQTLPRSQCVSEICRDLWERQVGGYGL